MARKLNKHFLLIVSSVLLFLMVAGGGVYLYKKKHKNPQKYLAAAKQAEQAGDYKLAAANYGVAGTIMHDPAVLTKAGDLLWQRAYDDDSNIEAARNAWTTAIRTDPGYTQALERELDCWLERKNLPGGGVPAVYDRITETAKKILANDPKNLAARCALPMVVIDSWSNQYESDPTTIDKAVKDLTDLQKEDPTNADIPYYIAMSYVTQGNRAQINNKPDDAAKFFVQANAVIDEALKTNANNGKLYFRGEQVTMREMTPPGDKAKLRAKLDRARELVQKSAALIKPTDPEFDDAVGIAAQLARDPESLKKDPDGDSRDAQMAAKDLAAQEKVLRDAIAAKPNDIISRVRLGDLLGGRPEHRDEAIDILKNLPEPAPADRAGFRGLNLKTTQLMGLSSLTNLRLDKVLAARTKAEQDALMPQIEQDYKTLEARGSDNPLVLRLNAKMQLAKNNVTDAVATLSQAIAKTDARNPLHYELMYLAAKCYLTTNQSGSAKAYLEEICKNFPTYDEARILLAETQLKEFKYTDAAENLDVLEKPDHSPNDMRVIRMRIACLEGEKKPDEAKKVYARLPEQTLPQALDKAAIAFLMQQPEEGKRLLQGILKADPGDVNATLMLSSYYGRSKDTANAAAVIDAALKIKPGDPNLMMARAQLSGNSPEEMKKIRMAEIEKITDPLDKELALLELTSNDSDENVPLSHLKKAEQINPNDQRVVNAMFEYNVAKHNWDQADSYLQRLATMNADKVKGTLLRWKMAMARAAAESDAQQRTKLYVKALDLATQLTHDYPDFAQSWLSLGQSDVMLGRYEDAIPQFVAARDKQPQNPDVYRGLIQCYYQMQQPGEAGKIIDQALAALPGMPLFKELKLQHELQYGNPEKAVADREQAVKDDPNSAQARMQLAEAYNAVARVKSEKPETEKQANEWLEKSKKTLADAAAKFPDELQFTVVHGTICLQLKQADQGEKLWKTTIARDQWKNNPDAIAEFAGFYLRANKPDDAAKVYRDFLATAAGKDNAGIAFRLVDVLASQKKYDGAMAVIDSMGDNPQARYRKIDLLINQGKFADAEKLVSALMQQQKTPELQTALAMIDLNTGKPDEAMKLLNDVLNQKPGLVQALQLRAAAQAKLPVPDWDSAVSDLVQVRQSAPQNIQARYQLADALLHTNDASSAMKELEGILTLSPSQKPARIRLIDLYSSQDPPRWLDAERIANAGNSIPELTNDADFLAAEARLYAKRKDTDRAVTYAKRAMQTDPKNVNLVRTYFGVLANGKKYQDILSETDQVPADQKDLWWVHSDRGLAKCKLGDKDGGMQEFVTALNATFATKDEPAGRAVIDQMSDAAGVDAALKVVAGLPQANQPEWLLSQAWLQQKKGDLPAARKTVEQVLANLDKLPVEQREVALAFAGSVYMQTPDPNFERARDIYLQLLALTPNDYAVYNNLACNHAVSAPDALQYSRKAYDLMTSQHVFDPLVADTYGWALIQSGDERNLDMGLNKLLEAWGAKHVVDIAYHLGEAYLKKNNAPEADNYLTQAQALYSEAIANKTVVDMTLQNSIVDAQSRAAKLRNKK